MGTTRKVTLPVPRCPFCHAVMQEAQLYWDAELMWVTDPAGRMMQVPRGWHETWICDSCHSQHTFPARLEFLEYVKDSQLLPRASKTLHRPFLSQS